MGKRHVRIVLVRKWVTLVLLGVTTALMLGLLYLLSGKAYAADTHPMRDMLAHLLGARRAPVSRGAVVALLMPIVANVLLFVPWGFLAFVALDRPTWSRRRTYLLTVLGGVIFASAMVLWQLFLPTRVTSAPDAVSNALGAFAGAALGHARKGMRISFDIGQ